MSKDILGQAEKKEVGFHMMKTIFLILLALLTSCARTASSVEKESVRAETEAQSDAAADAALGALEKSDQTEAQKEAEEIELQGETNQTLRELEERRRREEEERLHRAITSDSLLEEQVRG